MPSTTNSDDDIRLDIAQAKRLALAILYEYSLGVDDTDRLYEIVQEAHRIKYLTDEEFMNEVSGR